MLNVRVGKTKRKTKLYMKIIVQPTIMSVLHYGDILYSHAVSILKELDIVYHCTLCFITGDKCLLISAYYKYSQPINSQHETKENYKQYNKTVAKYEHVCKVQGASKVYPY